MTDIFTNREIAIGFAAFAFFGLSAFLAQRKNGDLWSITLRVIRAAFQLKLLIPLLLYLFVSLLAVLLASKIDLWNTGLWKPTVLWLIFSGGSFYFGSTEALKNPTFFHDKVKQSFKVMVVVQFVANLKSFSLWLEITTQIIAVFCGIGSAAASDEPKYRTHQKVSNRYLTLLGFCALGWSVWSTVVDWEQFNLTSTILEILLPIWMMLISVPYIYLLVTYAAYETTFAQFRAFGGREHKHQRPRRRRQLLAVLLRGRLRIHRIQLLGKYAPVIGKTNGFREAWREISKAIQEDRQRRVDEEVAKLRLEKNTGLKGVYQNGEQLDQREHTETKDALHWLWTCQAGHYRNLQRYRNDKVFHHIIQSTSKDKGLPHPTDIELHVSKDGQSWYAVRKTITGHWFAIGAAEPPSDQWMYDGPTKPVGFPNAQEWDQWGVGGHSVNWD